MNERIQKLALQAGIHFHKGGTLDAGPNGIAKFVLYSDMEKFAELIVREYETLLPEICPWVDADKAGPMKGWHVAFVARKHFGVEE